MKTCFEKKVVDLSWYWEHHEESCLERRRGQSSRMDMNINEVNIHEYIFSIPGILGSGPTHMEWMHSQKK